MKASIGRTVIVHGLSSNGSVDQPAVITRVWSNGDTKALRNNVLKGQP